jgi:hypothetical protein
MIGASTLPRAHGFARRYHSRRDAQGKLSNASSVPVFGQ